MGLEESYMSLNLPINEAISDRKSILIAGMGGGFDVFCGLPIYFELKKQGRTVHLASFSFSDIVNYKGNVQLTETLKAVGEDDKERVVYFPELYLARWFNSVVHEETAIWCFQKTGARPLLQNYRILQNYLGLDCIILVDGGVDSLVRGDEPATGTLIEDATSLFAVNELSEVPTRIICCVGLGIEPDLSYYHILENIARLTEAGGFLGTCSLVPKMSAYKLYEDAVNYVQGMRLQDPSVINSSIVSAVQGHYADYHMTKKTEGSRLWISPLMGIYWFFDLPIVANLNLYLPNLRHSESFMDAMISFMTTAGALERRPWQRIPLP
jgi:hypothetical protein